MNREEITELLYSGVLSQEWHWFSYQFNPHQHHFFSASIIDACYNIEAVLEGYTKQFAKKLSSISNKPKFEPHYEQLLQLLAELHVLNHLALTQKGSRFLLEPTSTDSPKNPEVGIFNEQNEMYVEVKCKEFLRYHRKRGGTALQLTARVNTFKEYAELEFGNSEILYPPDNVVKDFLVSANDKFSGLKKTNPQAINVLVIVWDDYIFEPITALLYEQSGLLTPNSFFKLNGENAKFDSISGIILVRHVHLLVDATRDEFFLPFSWDSPVSLPKAFIPVNCSGKEAEHIMSSFNADHIDGLSNIAADYKPLDLVHWIRH